MLNLVRRIHSGFIRPYGTFTCMPLFPALKRWATGSRSSGAVQGAQVSPLAPILAIFLSFMALLGCAPSHANRIVIGSKNFTEQLILGEILAQHIESKTRIPVDRRFYLAGTFICQQGIL